MVSEIFGTVPDRALAVYAHPDDPHVSCGGTLALWARRGAEVHVVICTNGDKGTADPRTDPAELAQRRSKEAAMAAERLGLAGQHPLGYPDGDLPDRRCRGARPGRRAGRRFPACGPAL